MYMHQDVYTIIFDSEKSVSAEKDTTIRQVVVEWAYLHQQRVKQYHFAKDNGVWRLKNLTRMQWLIIRTMISMFLQSFFVR